MQLHPHQYLTLNEVQARWKCSANDLKKLILDERLIPSFIINHVAKKVRFSWQQDCEPPYWLPVVVETETDADWDCPPSNLHDTHGIYYLLHPELEPGLECKFLFFSKDRNHQMGPDDENNCFMFSLHGTHPLSRGISLEMVFEKGVITMAEIERYEAEQALSKKQQEGCRWPWGSHHTTALGYLEAAAKRFWLHYDPTDNTTAPTNEEVSNWLKSEYGVSSTLANSIASILRPDGLPTGPRK